MGAENVRRVEDAASEVMKTLIEMATETIGDIAGIMRLTEFATDGLGLGRDRRGGAGGRGWGARELHRPRRRRRGPDCADPEHDEGWRMADRSERPLRAHG